MDVYVGNLPFDTTEEELRRMFEPFGPIGSIFLINDTFSQRPLGFGFVDLLEDDGVSMAVAHWDHNPLRGRILIVSETEQRVERRVYRGNPCCVQVK